MRYWLPITEDELYVWSQSYVWHLPQKPISVRGRARAAADFVKKRIAALAEPDEDSLVIAEFDSDHVSPQVPFFKVDSLYGLSGERAEILRDRYAAFGLQTQQLDESRATICREAIARVQETRANDDVRLGALALLEIFQKGLFRDFEPVVAEATRSINGERDSLLTDVFAYSRSEPWKCDGLLSGLCDLGKILRHSLTGADLEMLQRLSLRTADVLRHETEFSYATVVRLLDGLDPNVGFDPSLALFLSWKYAAERKNGRIDIDCISKDIAKVDNEDIVKKALCLFGAFSGFAAMADVYHQRMRMTSGQ